MSPLSVEVFHPDKGEWGELYELEPKDGSRSMRSLLPNGKTTVFSFACVDDSKSVVKELDPTEDPDDWSMHTTVSSKVKILAELSNEKSFELSIKRDINSEPSRIRLTHKGTKLLKT